MPKRKQDLQLLQESAAQAAALMQAVGNQHRLLVLCLLIEHGEMTVGALNELVALSPSALSQHLAKMKAAGIVASRREGQTLHYRLAGREVRAVMETLYNLYCAPEAGADC